MRRCASAWVCAVCVLCVSRENLPQSIMLRKANDSLFGVTLRVSLVCARSFVVNIARRGGWIEREQAFANAYSFLAVIDCRSHFSRMCAFWRNRCVFERLVGVCVECACVVSSTSRRRVRCVLAESKYASGAVAEGGRQLMLGVIAGDVGGVCSSFRHGCAYFGVLACFTRNKRTQNTRI